ncbi:MAG TPA: DNA-processing protein DprA [Xanthomonadaceae bacterium]|nr:DNA-processing protein DprA [Xanthomonadaceae bacterium]
MSNDPHDALLRLLAAGGPAGPRRRLLAACRDPAAAVDAGVATWRANGLSPRQVAALRSPDQAALDRAKRWLSAAHARHLLGWTDPDYPELLRRMPGAPIALFVAGDVARLWHPAVAVVGSRAPTAGGREHAAEFARAFAAAGLAVTSGLAAGIDTAAHHGALGARGLTVAVLGTGPDVAYPEGNAGLLQRIAQEGAVVTEHFPGTRGLREHFPSRNRIIAGLSLGTLVVEAAHRSGALITARLAADAGREVMALPGSIRNPMARGCHRLLRDGAALVERPQDVIDAVATAAAALADALRGRLGTPIQESVTGVVERDRGAAGDTQPTGVEKTPDYKRLWRELGHDPMDMDALVSRTGLTAAELASMLLVMELEGRVVSQHGRYTRRVS